MNKKITLLSMILCLMIGSAAAQISVTTLVQTYSQDFNSLAGTGATGSALPPAWHIQGATYRVSDGAANNGSIYSFGDSLSSERALGSIASGSFSPLFGVQFVNNTGATITKINLHYMVEMWRLGQKPAVRLDSMTLAYNIDVDSLQQTGWTNVPAAVSKTPDTTGTAGARSGNVNPNRELHNHSITGLNIPNGSNFWLRWSDANVSGNDDGLAIDSLSVAFEGGVLLPCTEPALPATAVVATGNTTSTVTGTFTGSVADAYLVVIDSVAGAPAITDGTTYTVGQAIGSGKVVSNSSSTTFLAAGLVSNTTYYVYVFPYNNTSCSGGPNYNTTLPGADTALTRFDACPEPSVKPTNLQFTTVTNSSIVGKFNKTIPAPTGYVVVFSKSSNVAYPLDSSTYSLGDSIKFGSFKSKVAYVGTDSNFSILGLDSATRYYVAVVPYNLCGAFPNYNRTTPLRDDTLTGGTLVGPCVAPDTVLAITVTTITTSSISGTITAPVGGADGYVVVYRKQAFLVAPRDSVTYTVGDVITATNGSFLDTSYVGYVGASTSFTLSGLDNNSKYYFAAIPYRACSGFPNYNVKVSFASNKTSATTGGSLPCPAPDTIRGVTVTGTTSSTITGTFGLPLATVADGFIVIYRTSSFLAAPSDSVTYTVGQLIIKTSGSFTDSAYVGFVGTNGASNAFTITGLSPSTKYYFAVIPYKSCTYGPNYNVKIGGSSSTNSNRGIATTTVSTGIRNKNSEAEFSLYPNPASNGQLYLKFTNTLKENAVVQVLDVAGRQLSIQKIVTGSNTQMIDVSSLAKGTYLLNVVYKGTNNVSTFIIE